MASVFILTRDLRSLKTVKSSVFHFHFNVKLLNFQPFCNCLETSFWQRNVCMSTEDVMSTKVDVYRQSQETSDRRTSAKSHMSGCKLSCHTLQLKLPNATSQAAMHCILSCHTLQVRLPYAATLAAIRCKSGCRTLQVRLP